MSMTLTLRRAATSEIEGLSGDQAVAFCFGLENGELVQSDDLIQFFSGWHIVHFLASGTEWDNALPAGFILGGNDWVKAHPDEEPLRILNQVEVAAASKYLESLSEDLIAKRLDVLTSRDVSIYGGPLDRDTFGPAMNAWETVKQFLAGAAERGMSICKGMG